MGQTAGKGRVGAVPPRTATATGDYVIGPGDTIRVFVLRNPELAWTCPCGPDGKITTPRSRTWWQSARPRRAQPRHRKGAGEYVRSPQVSVIVLQPASAYSQVRVVGQLYRRARFHTAAG